MGHRILHINTGLFGKNNSNKAKKFIAKYEDDKQVDGWKLSIFLKGIKVKLMHFSGSRTACTVVQLKTQRKFCCRLSLKT